MESVPHVTKVPKGKASDHKGWMNAGRSKMSWRMMFKLLLLMALDDWDWRREQRRKARKLKAGQRERLDHADGSLSEHH